MPSTECRPLFGNEETLEKRLGMNTWAVLAPIAKWKNPVRFVAVCINPDKYFIYQIRALKNCSAVIHRLKLAWL
jgi:hypothetical protein